MEIAEIARKADGFRCIRQATNRLARKYVQIDTIFVPSPPHLQAAEKEIHQVVTSISVLSQLAQYLELPIAASLLEELTALARAQRRVLRAAHIQLEADPLLTHLLKARKSYRHADRFKSNKRLEDEVCQSFYLAQSVGFQGDIHDWRKLLAIFPR